MENSRLDLSVLSLRLAQVLFLATVVIGAASGALKYQVDAFYLFGLVWLDLVRLVCVVAALPPACSLLRMAIRRERGREQPLPALLAILLLALTFSLAAALGWWAVAKR